MRTNIGMCLAAILFILSASPVAAQSPAGAQDDGGQTGAGESLLIDRIDPERLRQIRNERTRQFILGAGMMAAGGVVGFTKNEWTIDEGVFGIVIAALGLSLFVEPLTWRDLEVSTSSNGLTLEW
jgi:hypothetical protein